jgi:hypothetical protein
MPLRKVYSEYKYQKTVDMSDYRPSAKSGPGGTDAALVAGHGDHLKSVLNEFDQVGTGSGGAYVPPTGHPSLA